MDKKIKIAIAIAVTCLLAFGAALVFSQDTLINADGATCDIPDGFNTAPYHDLYNKSGMVGFCEFPNVEALANFFAILARLRDTGLVHPICDEGLVISPSIQVFPCYRLIESD